MAELIVTIDHKFPNGSIKNPYPHGLEYQYYFPFKDRLTLRAWLASKWKYKHTLIDDLKTVVWKKGFRLLGFTFEKLWYIHPSAVVAVITWIYIPVGKDS